jgi:hypothetical protein
MRVAGLSLLRRQDVHMTITARPGLRSVLAKAGCRRLFAAQAISRWGDAVNTVALAVLVFRTAVIGGEAP